MVSTRQVWLPAKLLAAPVQTGACVLACRALPCVAVCCCALRLRGVRTVVGVESEALARKLTQQSKRFLEYYVYWPDRWGTAGSGVGGRAVLLECCAEHRSGCGC